MLDCSVYDMSESLFDTVRSDPDTSDAAGRHRQRHAGESGRQPAQARSAEHVLLDPEAVHRRAGRAALDELLIGLAPSP